SWRTYLGASSESSCDGISLDTRGADSPREEAENRGDHHRGQDEVQNNCGKCHIALRFLDWARTFALTKSASERVTPTSESQVPVLGLMGQGRHRHLCRSCKQECPLAGRTLAAAERSLPPPQLWLKRRTSQNMVIGG